MTCDDEDDPRTALLLGFSLETEWDTPIFQFYSTTVL